MERYWKGRIGNAADAGREQAAPARKIGDRHRGATNDGGRLGAHSSPTSSVKSQAHMIQEAISDIENRISSVRQIVQKETARQVLVKAQNECPAVREGVEAPLVARDHVKLGSAEAQAGKIVRNDGKL